MFKPGSGPGISENSDIQSYYTASRGSVASKYKIKNIFKCADKSSDLASPFDGVQDLITYLVNDYNSNNSKLKQKKPSIILLEL